MRKLVAYFLVGVWVGSSAIAQVNPSDRPTASAGISASGDTVDAFINERMRAMQIPGLALAVLKDGQLIKLQAYGAANLETSTPATPESVFMVASLSKAFIATAVLLLQQDGKLSLNDKVSQYIKGLPDGWSNISLLQLLQHTSGLLRDPGDYHPYVEQGDTAVIQSMYTVPLHARPGQKWLYSNVGYYLLAEVITRVSGQSWDRFITKRIFVPGGMKATRINSTKTIILHRVDGYQQTANGRINAEQWLAVRPSSGFLSTIQDLAQWDTFLDKGAGLTNANRALLWTPGQLTDKTPLNYELGWYIDSFLGRPRIHHDGQYPGFRADYERFPDDRLSVIVLANSDHQPLESLAIKIAGLYASRLTTPTFAIKVKTPSMAVTKGSPVAIDITARDEGQAAPGSILEMEIWDASGQVGYKQHQENVAFAAAETKRFPFLWTPQQAGVYTVNVGTYGPRWVLGYTWKLNLATIQVK